MPSYVLDKDDVATLRQMLRWFKSLRGPGVVNKPGGAVISRQQRLLEEITANPNRIRLCRIGAATETGVDDANTNPVQWTYAITEVVKTTAGYGGWTNLENGYSGPGAFHGAEDTNDGTGRQLNGVDHDGSDYPAGFAMQPLQEGLVPVPFILTAVPGAGSEVTIEAWILPMPNGEDGTCS